MATIAPHHAAMLDAWSARHSAAAAKRFTCDRELLAALRARDKDALAAVADRFGRSMARVAYLHLGDAHAADDAAQDALLAAWDSAGRTNDATPLWPWLLGVLLNICRKHHRTLARRERRERVAAEHRQQDVGASEQGRHDADQLDSLRAAMAELDEPMRDVVILRYEQGLSVADTAVARGVPEGTVKSRCHAAVQKLKRLLNE